MIKKIIMSLLFLSASTFSFANSFWLGFENSPSVVQPPPPENFNLYGETDPVPALTADIGQSLSDTKAALVKNYDHSALSWPADTVLPPPPKNSYNDALTSGNVPTPTEKSSTPTPAAQTTPAPLKLNF